MKMSDWNHSSTRRECSLSKSKTLRTASWTRWSPAMWSSTFNNKKWFKSFNSTKQTSKLKKARSWAKTDLDGALWLRALRFSMATKIKNRSSRSTNSRAQRTCLCSMSSSTSSKNRTLTTWRNTLPMLRVVQANFKTVWWSFSQQDSCRM